MIAPGFFQPLQLKRDFLVFNVCDFKFNVYWYTVEHEVVDIEAWVLEVVMTKTVKAEPGESESDNDLAAAPNAPPGGCHGQFPIQIQRAGDCQGVVITS